MNKRKKKLLVSTLSFLLCASTYANNITTPSSTDGKIANSIRLLMELDPIVNSGDITVSALNKNVRLSGQTNSRTQYEEVISLVNTVDDVKSIDSSKLQIKKSKNYLADAYTTGKIKGKLISDKVLETHQPNPFYVNVETVNGNVYLTGVVEDRNQAISAISTAYGIKAVKSVTSYLKMTNDNNSVIF